MTPSYPLPTDLLLLDDELDVEAQPPEENPAELALNLARSKLRHFLAQTGESTQALNRLHAATRDIRHSQALLQRLITAAPTQNPDTYWQSLAPGFSHSRLDVAARHYRSIFALKALVHRAMLAFSEDSLKMAQALAEHFAEANDLTVFTFEVPATSGQATALSSALLIESTGQKALHLLFAPGFGAEFFEFESRSDLQQTLEKLLRVVGYAAAPQYRAWDKTQDVFFEHLKGALEETTQTVPDRFIQDLPAPWLQAIDAALADDAALHRQLVSFGSLSSALPIRQCENKLALHQQRIQACVGEDDEQVEAFAQYRGYYAQLEACSTTTQAITNLIATSTVQLSADFWTRNKSTLIEQRRQGLLAEARLQRLEGALSASDLAWVEQALAADGPGAVTVFEPCISAADGELHGLNGALVITSQSTLGAAASSEPALLFLPGEGGGLQKFSSLQTLQRDLELTLNTGLDTPFWRQVSPAVRGTLMTKPVQCATRAVAAPVMAHSVQAQLDSARTAIELAVSGERFYPDADSLLQTLSRLNLECADNLRIAENEARNSAVDRIAEQRRTAAMAEQLPQWLLSASAEIRREYGQRLTEYHAAVGVLESRLQARLPSFAVFTAQRLAARVKEDLGVELDADQVIVDLPKSVRQSTADMDIQYGVLKPGKTWVASSERVQLSFAELARHNVDYKDEEQTGRLSFARLSYKQPEGQPALDGLTPKYLLEMIPSLDITGQYRTLLKEVFLIQPAASAQEMLDTEVLLKPYELEILLDGFVARQRKHLFYDASYRLLQDSALARSEQDLREAHIQMYWLVYKPGTAVSGERAGGSGTLDGLCVIHQQLTKKTLVYLPQAPGSLTLIEADSLAQAKERLMARLLMEPKLVAYLASRLSGDSNPDREISYINRALVRNFQGFIEFTPALRLLMTPQQFQVREWLLHEQTRIDGRSLHDVRREQGLRQNQRYWMYFRAILSFVPGLGSLISIQNGWNDGHAAAQAFAQGKSVEGEMLVASAALSVLDVLLSVVPGTVGLTLLAKAARRATRLRQATRLTHGVPGVTRKSYVITPFKGYEADVSLHDAVPQTGKDTGTWLKNKQLWIPRDGKTYPVYRRKGEQTLRLKKTAGYEPPVRLTEGRWVYHLDGVGGKGGHPSRVAERLICEGDPSLSSAQARQLLDQFEFPVGLQQHQMELQIANHYRTNRTIPAWAEAYRRSTMSQAVPPTSPRPGLRGSNRRPAQPTPGTSQGGMSLPPADTWKNWQAQLDDLTLLDEVPNYPETYRVAGPRSFEVVRIQGGLYEILPPGSMRYQNTVLLKSPLPADAGLSELNAAIRVNRNHQPMVASFENGQWVVERTLFPDTIEHLIARYRPGLTRASQGVLAQRLFDLADSSGSTLTSTRLINMTATLVAWSKGNAAPLSALNDPLTMLSGLRPRRLRTSATSPPTQIVEWNGPFSRLDFLTQDPAIRELLISANFSRSPHIALGILMRRVLSHNGYQILSDTDLTLHALSTLVFKRPGQREIYWMHLQRAHFDQLQFPPASYPSLPLSNAWIDLGLSRQQFGGLASTLQTARSEGRLVKLFGSISTYSGVGLEPQVFVVRLADDV